MALLPILLRTSRAAPSATASAESAMMAGITTLFYCMMAYSHCMAAVMRGCGRSLVPMLVMLVCWCAIRVSYITISVRIIPDIRCVFWAYPITWALSTIVYTVYYFRKKPLGMA